MLLSRWKLSKVGCFGLLLFPGYFFLLELVSYLLWSLGYVVTSFGPSGLGSLSLNFLKSLGFGRRMFPLITQIAK